jgi:hypothetical protein
MLLYIKKYFVKIAFKQNILETNPQNRSRYPRSLCMTWGFGDGGNWKVPQYRRGRHPPNPPQAIPLNIKANLFKSHYNTKG